MIEEIISHWPMVELAKIYGRVSTTIILAFSGLKKIIGIVSG